jgi:signal transduction histidine kinase
VIARFLGLRARSVVLVVAGALLSHLVALAIYLAFNASSLSDTREQNIIGRLATVVRLLENVPAERRAAMVADLSMPDFELELAATGAVLPEDSEEGDTRFLRTGLAHALNLPAGQWVYTDYELAPGDRPPPDFEPDPARTVLAERVAHWFRFREDLFVSLQLGDGSWLNARVKGSPLALSLNLGLFWSLLVMAAAIAALTAWAVARPLAELRRVARAAEALGKDVEGAPALPERGPAEIRATAHAFNLMRDRIRTMVEDRTRMLAAMSHDLRTPLTRLRLRAEYVSPGEERERMLRDIADMEEMVAASLSFIGDGVEADQREPVDFISLLTDLCLDLDQEPPEFHLQGARRIRVLAAPVALRRAFTNLIDNARKYAGGAEIRVDCRGAEVITDITDHGPGIPPEEYENVFKSYYRLEPSRSRRTGGYGLGLAIARSVVRSHGGDITLGPAPGGGLRVQVALPLAPGG